jgi:DNA-binding transcriptional LysR family regulator
VQAAEAGAEALRATPRGKLRVSAPVSFGSEYLVPAITEYLERYPEVTLELDLDDRMVDVVKEGFDAAIRVTHRLDDSGLVARFLQPNRRAGPEPYAAILRHLGRPTN